MKPISQIIRSIPKYQPTKQNQLPLKRNRKDWWTPIWRGLANDYEGKHRKAMGISLWTYLYLLSFTNRTTGIVRKSAKIIALDSGLPLRTVQRHLKRLVSRNYITFLTTEHYPKIRIEKWKSFNHPKANEG